MSSSTNRYTATIGSLDNRAVPTTIQKFQINEYQGRGWSGIAIVDPYPDRVVHLGTAFNGLYSRRLLPGSAVVVRLSVQGRSGRGDQLVRTWPSIVTNAKTVGGANADGSDDSGLCQISFTDPINYFGTAPIWGAFVDNSPGEIVGGALSLAEGGDGMPTQTPTLSGLPSVLISQSVHESLRAIPYVIGAGEPLSKWLFFLLGRLGIRMEMYGDLENNVGIELKDMRSTETPLRLTVQGTAEDSATNGTILSVQRSAYGPARGTVLDNPTTGSVQRAGPLGAIGSIVNSAETTLAQVEEKARFRDQFSYLKQVKMGISSSQPYLRPGRIVVLSSETTNNESSWQVGDIQHSFDISAYRNISSLYFGALPWRPPVPSIETHSITVSAVVDDGESEQGEVVQRNRLGYIPVVLSFSQSSPDSNEAGATQWSPRLHLPVIEQMAGSAHGFLPAHRQGDICRVSTRGPLFAEILGFSYRDNLRIGEDLVDSSAGIVVQQDSEDWSGLIFRPSDYFANDAEGGSDTPAPD